MKSESNSTSEIFADLCFGINNWSLDGESLQKISNILVSNGARIFPLNESELDLISHIISEDYDFPLYKLATEKEIQIITPQWVYSSLAVNRLLSAESYSTQPQFFFSGVVIIALGIPESDADELYGYVSYYGGDFRLEMDESVTHIIALKLSNDVMETSEQFEIPVVIPEWIQDCVALQHKLPTYLYLLPNPQIRHPDPQLPSSDSEQNRNSIFLQNHVLYISPDCQFELEFTQSHVLSDVREERNEAIRKQVYESVQAAGGLVVEKFDPSVCTCVVLNFRSGQVYIKAEERGLWVASPKWLLDVLESGIVSSPKLQLLHYPKPLYPVEGFQNLKISVTNYANKARNDVGEIVSRLGAKFTKQLSIENTHLICAKTVGEKYSRSNEWSIHLCNHLWLERCLATSSKVAEANLQFLNFHPCLESIIGKTHVPPTLVEKSVEIAKKTLGQHSSPNKEQPAATVSVPSKSSTVGEKDKGKRRMGSPEMGDIVSSVQRKRSRLMANEGDDFEDEDDVNRSPTRFASKKSATSNVRPRSLNKQKVNDTFVLDEVENENKGLDSSITERLTSKAPEESQDIGAQEVVENIVQAAPSIVASELAAKKSVARNPSIEKQTHVKKPVSNVSSPRTPRVLTLKKTRENEEGMQNSRSTTPQKELSARKTKRQKTVSEEPRSSPRRTRLSTARDEALLSTPPSTTSPVLCFTGVRLDAEETAAVKKLGGTITQEPLEATHIIGGKVMRTEKMLIGINRGLFVVTKGWLTRCIEVGRFVAERGYMLVDKESEKNYSYTLTKALKNARSRPLFLVDAGVLNVLVTANVSPDFEILRKIVESGGGKITRITSHTTPLPPTKLFKSGLVLAISSPADHKLFSIFTTRGINVYTIEKLLTGVLKQEIIMDDEENLLKKAHVEQSGEDDDEESSEEEDQDSSEEYGKKGFKPLKNYNKRKK
ncbi:hypothetical protein HK098_000045 [Nowakowskiella sp. JEL0407]|nr:hypothetical protein HK098_000045 [Nowakowskiella sp. JEL0407]